MKLNGLYLLCLFLVIFFWAVPAWIPLVHFFPPLTYYFPTSSHHYLYFVVLLMCFLWKFPSTYMVLTSASVAKTFISIPSTMHLLTQSFRFIYIQSRMNDFIKTQVGWKYNLSISSEDPHLSQMKSRVVVWVQKAHSVPYLLFPMMALNPCPAAFPAQATLALFFSNMPGKLLPVGFAFCVSPLLWELFSG